MSMESTAFRPPHGRVDGPASMSVSPEHSKALDAAGNELRTGTTLATLAESFRRAMRLLDESAQVRRAALLLADGSPRTLRIEAAYGIAPADLRPRLGLGVSGRVAESGRPIVVPAVRRDPMALSEFANPAAWHAERLSLVSVPVLVGGRCAGALAIYFADEGSAKMRSRLEVLAGLAAALSERLKTAGDPAIEDGAKGPSERVVFEYANMIGTSAVMRQVYEEIGQVAQTTATALILGESGTGKELVAQAIHENSERAEHPFVKLNGAAFPEALFESELFGHERGAFTGAVSRKKGRLDLAQGGTLFLDEIGDLPLSTQVKLLRVLQFREYERLGGAETLKADVRLIAATNKPMANAVASGAFREDLYYRLNVFTITVPPLRDRRGDVPALAEYFVGKYSRQHRRRIGRIASGALDRLCEYAWPGNVRELENAVERAVVVCGGFVIEERHLPEPIRAVDRATPTRKLSMAETVEQLERAMIEDALRVSEGNLARASRALGTTERILRYKVGKYKLGAIRGRR